MRITDMPRENKSRENLPTVVDRSNVVVIAGAVMPIVHKPPMSLPVAILKNFSGLL